MGALLFSAVIFVLPEGAILRPIIRGFGWGPQGPVKGTKRILRQKLS